MTSNQPNTGPVPDDLIMEVIGETPIFYRDFQEVIAGRKTLEEIMGSSRFQSLLVTVLAAYLLKRWSHSHWVASNEGGLHLSKGTSLSLDIALYSKADLPASRIDDTYFQEIPELVVEVDTKADPIVEREFNYVNKKTQTLLDAGVRQVIWIFTAPRKIMTARPGAPWLTVNWEEEIPLLGQPFVLEPFLKEQGIIEY